MSPAVLIFSVLVLAIAMSQFARAALSVVAPDIMGDVGLTAVQYANMAGAFFLGIAVAQIPTGVLLDRFGARITMSVMQFVAALALAAFALADGFWDLSAARFLTGIGFASALMGGLVVASRWFPRDRFAQVAATLIAASQAAGLLLAATPMAALAEATGWRVAFLIFALLIAASAGALWLILRDAPADHPWHRRKRESLARTLGGYLDVWRLPGMGRVVAAAMIGYPVMITLVGVWGGPYLADVHGLDGLERGNVLSVLIVSGVVGLMVYGPLDRLLNTRKWLVIAGVGLASLVLFALALISSPPLWLVIGLFVLYGLIGAYYIVNIAQGRALYPEHLVGRGVTTINLGTFFGVALIQFLSGRVIDVFEPAAGAPPETAYRALFGFLAVYGLVLVLPYLGLRDQKPSEDHGAAETPEKAPGKAPADGRDK